MYNKNHVSKKHIMTLEELKKLIENHESERVELKEWKGSIPFDGHEKFESRQCVLGYCVAIGNEGGGYLIIGVNDRKEIIGTSAQFADDAKKKIYDKTEQKIEIEEIYDGGHKVIVVTIPGRMIGRLLKFGHVPLMRVHDSLEVMSDQEQARILLEGQDDFSAKICKNSSIDSLDETALARLRELYVQKNPSTRIDGQSDERLLQDLGLMKGAGVTNAGVILLGKKEFLDEYLAQAEICFEYRNRSEDIQFVDRVNYRKPFILAAQEIWDKIYSRQQMHQIQQGLFRTNIPAYNEEVFREALFNAVCHRDYAQQGSIYIKQAPEYLEISNPGGLPFGVTVENIVTAQSTPRNRLLAESFGRIFLGVERSGQGADKIFRNTIEEGKGSPDYSLSDNYSVVLRISAMLQDENFIKYIDKVVNEKGILISMSDLLLLEKIRNGDKEGITLSTAKHLLTQGLIELHGKTRGAQYVLSTKYYSHIGRLGERTRRIGLSRDKCKELILEHLRKHKKGDREEFLQIFPELKPKDITNMLTELRLDGKIRNTGKGRWSVWVLP